MACEGVSGNWNITELGYKCLTEPCVYSRSPYTTELSACFHLISFSFGCERCASMEANKLASGGFRRLIPRSVRSFWFPVALIWRRVSTSLTCTSAKVLTTRKATSDRNLLLFSRFFSALPSHDSAHVNMGKVSLREVREDENQKRLRLWRAIDLPSGALKYLFPCRLVCFVF